MSVAVPRPLNTSMTPNITSRPPTTSSSRAGPSSGKVAIPARPTMTSRPSSASTSTASSTAVAQPAAGLSKDTSSSAGKVFAKPSKEWVLPERAKPGRKVCAEEPDNKRQSQNRLSQRAHRARRTDYIQTLEERLRQYEADEIHSNVRLQEVARALKTDNERMKNELLLVKGKINELAAEREGWEMERKGMEDMCASLMSEVERLRSQAGDSAGGGLKLEPTRTAISSRPNPTHLVHSSDTVSSNVVVERRTGPTVACPICPDPDPDCPCQQPAQQAPPPPAAPHQSDCGLCQTPAECLCRVVKETQSPPKPIMTTKGKCDVCSSLTICLCEDDTPPPPLPPAAATMPRTAAAVSLPLRSRLKAAPAPGSAASQSKPLWRLDNVVKKGEAVCTGDPENCDACKNDSFGREFCGHLFEQTGTAGHVKPCNSCPGNCMSIPSLLSPKPDAIVQPPTPVPEENGDQETMRCDEAWKRLKAHPNAKFASLALLADVVAGRTKCTGPTIELTPAPPTPAPITATATASPSPTPRATSIGVGMVSAPLRSPLAPKPVSAGPMGTPTPTGATKRRVAVETSAVRDALRILDSTPSRATSEVAHVKTEPLDLDEVNERASKKLRVE